jgi:predicted membrane protein
MLSMPDFLVTNYALTVWGWIFLVFLLPWSFIWKGIALWKSARNTSYIWFIVLLLVNTLGILEILYIFVFSNCCVQNTAQSTKKEKK